MLHFLYLRVILYLQQEVLRHHGVMWFDASIRFNTSDWTDIYKTAMHTNGVALFRESVRKIFPVTYPTTYEYLPSNMQDLMHISQRGTHSMLFYKTKWVFDHVVWPAFLCALHRDCIATTDDRKCGNVTLERMDAYYCNRYDQAIINLLLVNQFVSSDIYCAQTLVLDVQRYVTHQFDLRVCSP